MSLRMRSICYIAGQPRASAKMLDAVRVVDQVLASLRLSKHPDKTFIGRVEKGFACLAYHMHLDARHVGVTRLFLFVIIGKDPV
jgi:hypothetical protein